MSRRTGQDGYVERRIGMWRGRYHTDVYLLPKWGKSAVECITPKVVNEWLIAPELKHLSRETLKGIVSTLQSALGRRFPRRSILYPSQTEVEDDPR